MNSFALLQDDVEDASDLSVDSPSSPQKNSKSDAPAVTVQDARAAREVERKKDSNVANGISTNHDSNTKQNDNTNDENDQSKNDQQDDDNKDEIVTPKEKEMTLEEYLEKKAALSSGLTSLKNRGLRQANDGKSDGFEKMRVVRKEEAPEGPLLADLHVKEEIADDKQVKDSTRAAVARNAEIQKFFQRDPLDNQRRRGDYRRGSGDRRNNGRGYGRGPNTNGRFNQDRNDGQNSRGGKFEPRGGGYRGGRGRGRGGRGGYRGGSYRDGYADGKYMPNGTSGSMAPNVDDTTAFPSL